MQNQLDIITMRMKEAEERIGDIEDKIMENNEVEKKRERKLSDHKGRLREFSNSIKHNNIHVIGSQKKSRKRGQKVYLNKLQLRTSLIWGKKQVFKSKRHRELPSKINRNRSTPRHGEACKIQR